MKMMKKEILIMVLALLASVSTACSVEDFFTKQIDENGNVLKEAPAETLSGILGLFGPLGIAGGVLLRSTVRNKRGVKAVFESVKTAIDTKSLEPATDPETIKSALQTAQNLHEDSKLIAELYKDWKAAKIKAE